MSRKTMKKIMACVLALACVIVTSYINPLEVNAASANDKKKYSKVFDAQYYYDNNADVAAAYGNNAAKLLDHYIAFGIPEGRNASATFNAKAYRELNPDLDAAFGDNWASYHEHYATCGQAEGRKAIGKGKGTTPNKNNAKQNNNAQAGKTIGTYTTYYDAKIPRANNVALAAAKINGMVIQPGAGFSFSQAVGARTTANGYVVAPIFVAGGVSQGVGGGICQVSSTLYAAMIKAGLPATERHPHSRAVTYIPSGMDATIAGNTKDLKFVNTFGRPLQINASANNGTLTVTLSLK